VNGASGRYVFLLPFVGPVRLAVASALARAFGVDAAAGRMGRAEGIESAQQTTMPLLSSLAVPFAEFELRLIGWGVNSVSGLVYYSSCRRGCVNDLIAIATDQRRLRSFCKWAALLILITELLAQRVYRAIRGAKPKRSETFPGTT